MRTRRTTTAANSLAGIARGRRWRVVVTATTLAACAAGLDACATDDDAAPVGPAPAPIPSSEDSGLDGGADADAETDAEPPCTDDCEFFVPTCSDEVLCPNELFDPSLPRGGPDQFDGRTSIHLVRGTSDRDIWAVGALGALSHFDGTSWVRSNLPLPAESPRGLPSTLRTLWFRNQEIVGVTAFDELYVRSFGDPSDAGTDAGVVSDAGADGGNADWTVRAPPSPAFNLAKQTIMSGWAPPGSETFWMVSIPPTPTTRNRPALLRLRPTSTDALAGTVVVTGIGSFVAIHGAAEDDFWVVGMDGVTVHVTGASGATPVTKAFNSQTRYALSGVWAASTTEAWSVGYGGTIRHYTGHPLVWEIVPGISEELQLNAVWGSSPTNVWAVGNDAVVLHFDGTRWARVALGGLGSRRPDLTTVWTSDPEHVWIGGEGVVLSFGGKR